MKKETVLIIDDHEAYQKDVVFLLRDEFDCVVARSAQEGLAMLQARNSKVVLLDAALGGENKGLGVLSQIHDYDESIPVIMMTDHASVSVAVQAIRGGAYNYVSKTPDIREIKMLIEQSLRQRTINLYNKSLREESDRDFYTIVGQSKQMQLLREQIDLYAHHTTTVLITGESGVGKELVARQLHQKSDRNKAPFVAVNCAAIPRELAESELFGHEKGAFTGADRRKIGKFELAGDGVIFLDEISDLSLEIQVKLLRILQEKEFQRVGGNAMIRTHAKLITATNRNLSDMVKQGQFRQDLYYRLDVLPLHVPALRERREDIPALVRHFIVEVCTEMKVKPKSIHEDAMALFCAYDWPGNIRQLRNFVTRTVILCRGSMIHVEQLDPALRSIDIEAPEVPKTWDEMDAMRKRAAEKAGRTVEHAFAQFLMSKFDGNVTKAAASIGIHRTNLHKLLRRAASSE